MSSEPGVYTRREMRSLFDVGNSTLSRWVQSGVIPKPFIRGRWRKSEIDQILMPTCAHLEPNAESGPTKACLGLGERE